MSSREADRLDPSALASLATALDSLASETLSRSTADELERLSRIVREFAMPRLGTDRPIDVVFAGPTGSGKSTLVNSVSGLAATTAGVLRPTTTRPVILTDRDRVDEYAGFGDVDGEIVVADSPALRSMTLVDTPDLDSTSTEHRVIAERLIDSADVVVFVMSALRYADLVPWQILRRTIARGAIVVPVLNRVTPGTAGSRVDFRSRLRTEGIGGHLVVIPEQRRNRDRIPRVATRPLARRLAELARDHSIGSAETLGGVVDHVVARARDHLEVVQRDLEDAPMRLTQDQIAAIDLSLLTAALPTPGIDGGGRRQLRRWRKQMNDALEERSLEQRVGDALAAIIRTEASLANLGSRLSSADGGSVQMAKAWLDFVSRVCAETDGRRGRADVAYLAQAVGDDGTRISHDPVFGPELPILADRVERDLRSRIAMTLDDARAEHARVDADRLSRAIEATRMALAGLAPAPAPAHA